MNPSWHTIRLYTKTLERYSKRVKDAVWSANERDLIDALADIAEVGEIARRLYPQLRTWIQSHPQQPPLPTHALQDEAHDA